MGGQCIGTEDSRLSYSRYQEHILEERQAISNYSTSKFNIIFNIIFQKNFLQIFFCGSFGSVNVTWCVGHRVSFISPRSPLLRYYNAPCINRPLIVCSSAEFHINRLNVANVCQNSLYFLSFIESVIFTAIMLKYRRIFLNRRFC